MYLVASATLIILLDIYFICCRNSSNNGRTELLSVLKCDAIKSSDVALHVISAVTKKPLRVKVSSYLKLLNIEFVVEYPIIQ